MSARMTMALGALLSLMACTYDFERSSEITDRRILAVQVDPPELAPGTPVPDSVRARALVVDPADPLAVAEVRWSSCLRPARAAAAVGRAENTRCPDDEGTVLHASGSTPIESVSQSIPVSGDVSGMLTAGEGQPAPQIHVQLEVDSEKGPLVAVKQVTVSTRLPEGQEPNRNPAIQGLKLDGTDWLPDEPRVIKYGDCPDERKREVVGEDDSLVKVCEYELEPFFDEAEQQFYEDRGFSGQQELQRERLLFAWFTTAGSFRQDITRSFDPRDPSPDNVGPKNKWREPPTKAERATLWVVVRDGRGGITWARREVIFE
jgi:hypothetical protein